MMYTRHVTRFVIQPSWRIFPKKARSGYRGDAPGRKTSVCDSPRDAGTAEHVSALLEAEGTEQTPIRNGNVAFFPILNAAAHRKPDSIAVDSVVNYQ
jgi:hypothetical protein